MDVLSTFVVGEPTGKVVAVLDGDKEVFRVALDALPPGENGLRLDVVAPKSESVPEVPEWMSRPRAELPAGEPGPNGPPPGPVEDGSKTRVSRLDKAGTKD